MKANARGNVSPWHVGVVAACTALVISLTATAARAEPVYEYRSDAGRRAFTNVRSLAPSNADTEELDLPSLLRLDLTQVNEAELERINERLDGAHRQLRHSESCEAARQESQISLPRLAYESNPRWMLLVGLACVLAPLLSLFRLPRPGRSGRRRQLTLWLLLAAVGLLGTAAVRTSSAHADRRATAQACGGELQPPAAADVDATRRRAAEVGRLQTLLTRRAQAMDARIEAASH